MAGHPPRGFSAAIVGVIPNQRVPRDSTEVTAHLQRAFVKVNWEEEEPAGDQQRDERDSEAAVVAVEVEYAAVINASDQLDPEEEERIRQLEESNQEHGELMRLHLLHYGHGDAVEGLDMLRARAAPFLTPVLNEGG
jgi:hypothetical protein